MSPHLHHTRESHPITLQDAIDSCPVDCIHWVKKEDLADLEFVMQNAKRATIASMMAGGYALPKPLTPTRFKTCPGKLSLAQAEWKPGNLVLY